MNRRKGLAGRSLGFVKILFSTAPFRDLSLWDRKLSWMREAEKQKVEGEEAKGNEKEEEVQEEVWQEGENQRILTAVEVAEIVDRAEYSRAR